MNLQFERPWKNKTKNLISHIAVLTHCGNTEVVIGTGSSIFYSSQNRRLVSVYTFRPIKVFGLTWQIVSDISSYP